MTTSRHAILTAIGADRPGLVEEVSQFIFAHGGNIADSRMVNLRGQFAMMNDARRGADHRRADV
jgi:glycine cleavage system transcriptional repressor